MRVAAPQFAAAGWTRRDVEDLLFYGVLGVVIGGRLGYVLFYKPGYYAANPLEIFAVWKGGMAFHGGLLGVIVAMALFARTRKRAVPARSPTWSRRACRPASPPGASATSSTASCGAAPPTRACRGRWSSRSRASPLPRHPSQLYQFALEGLLLFVLLWMLRAQAARRSGQVSGAFLVGYGVLRFIAEFFREPDSFLGLLALGMSMGQWLCVPMIVAGVALWLWGRGRAAQRASMRDGPDDDATDLPRHRNHRPEPRIGRPHHRDRLRRDGQPAPHRPQPALLRQPRAAQPARTRSRCTA